MPDTLPKAVLDAADVSAITQVVLREREGRDLARWDEMRACYHPDSVVRISWFRGSGADFVAGSIDMARRNIPARHRLAPVLITLAGDRAIASLGAVIDLPARLKGVEVMLSSFARLIYRVERRDGIWRISAFDGVYIRDEVTTAIPGQPIPVDLKELQPFRSSYRWLAYHLKSHGLDVSDNLPGEDRPETVAALNREISSWAGVPY